MTNEDFDNLAILNLGLDSGYSDGEILHALNNATIEVILRHAIAMSDIEEVTDTLQHIIEENN